MNRKIKKVMLIQPPAFVLKDKSDMNPNVPLGLAYIAGVLEKNGYEVRIIDAFIEGVGNECPVDESRVLIGLTDPQIESRLKDFCPDMIGVSSLFTAQRKNAHRVCEIARRTLPRSVVLMGGAHPTAEPEMVLGDKNVDYVVLGEGEYTVLELIRNLEQGKDISGIDGLCYRAEGGVRVNKKSKFIKDLDGLPFPARHLLPMREYFKFKQSHGVNKKSPYASIVTSRGCPFGCTFCSTHTVWGSGYRARSPGNVLKEIRHLIDSYGIKELLFEDDNLTLDKVRASAIFKGMVEAQFDLIWRTPNGVAVITLDKDMLSLMKKSGCYQLGFAIESGSKRVLKEIIKKPLILDRIPELVKHARRVGIEVILFLVVGMPGETIKDMEETFRFCRRLGVFGQQHISIATPYPGSELYETCKKNGYFAKGFDYDRLSIRNTNIETEDWTGKEVISLIKRERRKNHLLCLFDDPVLFLKAIFPENVKNMIKDHLKQKRAIDAYSSS